MLNRKHIESKCKTCIRNNICNYKADYESSFYALNKLPLNTRLHSIELHCDAYESVPNVIDNKKENYSTLF